MKVAIGSDHAGVLLKKAVINLLTTKSFEVKDFGPVTEDSVDYPDYAHPVANSLENNEFELGILICGSGNGINMTANKHQGIRAALCWEEEIASLARQHNNANILVLPARFISEEKALAIVETFFATAFEGGRHQNRVNKISC
jgi:ribose 5-phosphate isomerase B